MYKFFESFPLELRQKAYWLFRSLPVSYHSPSNDRGIYRLISVNNRSGPCEICPVGAINAALHGSDALPNWLLCYFEGGFAAAGYDMDTFRYEGLSEFLYDYDEGHISNLAEAMGVSGHSTQEQDS